MVRKNKRETWHNFVSKLENDITEPRPKTYKIIRALNNDVVEHVKLNPIKLESWLDYFQDLLSEQLETLRKTGSSNGYTEPIVEEELDNVLRKLKNNKAPGEDGLNLDLFKYAWKLFDRRF
jgi:hypothetical protein